MTFILLDESCSMTFILLDESCFMTVHLAR